MYIGIMQGRFGPVTTAYEHGSWVDIDQPKQCKRGVVTNLEGKHNRDYKVAYVSDPLVVFHGETDTTHDELREKLEEHGLWIEGLNPIEIIKRGREGLEYQAAFKSLPSSFDFFDGYKRTVNKNGEMVLETEHAIKGEL